MPYADYQRQLDANRERQKSPTGAANHARAVRAYRRRHKARRAAHNAVAKALRAGKITAWPVCAVPECNETDVQAHHADYGAPLDVVWLCDSHHKQAHALARQLEKEAA